MVRRLKIYFIHSNKMDYQNLLYRDIISSSVCLMHELMLPYSKNYEGKYVKDLLAEADIIIAEVSEPGFLLKSELKWALKTGKPIKYIALNNILSPKLKKLVPNIDQIILPEKPMIKIVEDFINQYANMTREEQADTTIVLGDMDETQEQPKE